jgi:hypothetical protein
MRRTLWVFGGSVLFALAGCSSKPDALADAPVRAARPPGGAAVLDALEVQLQRCKTEGDCPVGSRCIAERACGFDCRDDSQCGTGQRCDDRGECSGEGGAR